MTTAITGAAIGFIVWAVFALYVAFIPPLGLCWRKVAAGTLWFAIIGAAIGWLIGGAA